MAKRNRKQEEAPKPISVRAGDELDWLEELDGRGSLVRRFLLWWHRESVVALALEALEALAGNDKLIEKQRKAVGILVTSLGGPQIDWGKQQVKQGGEGG